MTLSLDSCTNALDYLSGLASISDKCLGLKNLSLIAVHGCGSMPRALFWSLLNKVCVFLVKQLPTPCTK